MASRYSLSGDRKRSPLSSFLRVIVELLVIVIGIYLAFQLENGREDKKIAALEKKYLEQLLEEAQINQTELKADQDARRIQQDYLKKLLASTTRPVAADTLREAITHLMTVRLYSPTEAVYQDLVSSGNLGIIKSDATKRILLNYRRALSRVPLTEQSDVKLIEDHLEPYLANKQVLSLLLPDRNIDFEVSKQQIDRIIRVLLSDRTFIDLVYLRFKKVSDVIYFENPMQWHLREMIKLLEAELVELNQ